MKNQNINNLKKQCDQFNTACKIGDRIMFKRDGVDEPYETRTRSEAYILSGHSAVVLVDGVSGCYQLSHCEPIAENQSPTVAANTLKVRLSRMLA